MIFQKTFTRNIKIEPIGTTKIIKRLQEIPKADFKTKEIKITEKKYFPKAERREVDFKSGKIQPEFLGETVYIVGGGPSLKDFNFDLLKGKHVIAINRAFEFVPFAEYLYWSDIGFYEKYKEGIHQFKGKKVTNKNYPLRNDIINLENTGKLGLETNPSAIKHGGNSGYAAINLAYHLGAKTIVLLGYDMQKDGKESHFHGGYGRKVDNSLYDNLFLPHFQSLVEPLRDKKVVVYNANINSKLECFTKCDIDFALNL